MFRIIIAIFASGLVGYMGGLAQERHYGHQRYLEGLDEGYGNAKKVIEAYKGGFHKGYEEHATMILKSMNGEEIEHEDSE
jgi:hypothetical protein